MDRKQETGPGEGRPEDIADGATTEQQTPARCTPDATVEEVLAEIEANQAARDAAALAKLADSYTALGEPKSGELMTLKLSDIVRDETLQMREKLDEGAVADFETKYEREKSGPEGLTKGERPFKLCDVYRLPDGTDVLANGFHRFEAMSRTGIKVWLFAVQRGDRREAACFAAGANRANDAVRLKNADKQRAARNLWNVYGNVSSRKIGEMAGVDHHTAEKQRPAELKDEERQDKNGRIFKPKKKTKSAKIKPANAAETTTHVPPAKTSTTNGAGASGAANGAGAHHTAPPSANTNHVPPAAGEVPQRAAPTADPVAPQPTRAGTVEETETPRPPPTNETTGEGDQRGNPVASIKVPVGAGVAWEHAPIGGTRVRFRVVAVAGGEATLQFSEEAFH